MSQPGSLFEAVAAARENEVMALVRGQIAAGVPAADILAECNRGMVELGNRFAAGECFLPDLMFAGMIMKGVMAELAPLLDKGTAAKTRGTVVMGSVQHDVHDIGKDIVVTMLRGVGFEVVDLGVDVPPEKFVEAIAQHKPQVVGMSVLLDDVLQVGHRHGRGDQAGGPAAERLDHGRRGGGQRPVAAKRRLRLLRQERRGRRQVCRQRRGSSMT